MRIEFFFGLIKYKLLFYLLIMVNEHILFHAAGHSNV